MGRLGVEFASATLNATRESLGYVGAFGWQEQINSIPRCNQGDLFFKQRDPFRVNRGREGRLGGRNSCQKGGNAQRLTSAR